MDLSFERVLNTENSEFDHAWKLYQEAFPIEERRELKVQKQIFQNGRYHFNVINNDSKFVGILLYWYLEGFLYIEHFAIHENKRGGGVGQLVMRKLMGETDEHLILEVEPPTTSLNKRRIEFYKRLGFKLNHYDYHQPPLRKGASPVKLLLMSYPREISVREVLIFKNELKSICFEPYAGM